MHRGLGARRDFSIGREQRAIEVDGDHAVLRLGHEYSYAREPNVPSSKRNEKLSFATVYAHNILGNPRVDYAIRGVTGTSAVELAGAACGASYRRTISSEVGQSRAIRCGRQPNSCDSSPHCSATPITTRSAFFASRKTAVTGDESS